PRLRAAVVGLARVVEQAGTRRRTDDAGAHLPAGLGTRPPVSRGPAHRCDVPLEMYAEDAVPVVFGEVDENAVAEDARVVDENVQVAEGLDRRLDQATGAVPARDVVGV